MTVQSRLTSQEDRGAPAARGGREQEDTLEPVVGKEMDIKEEERRI